MIKFPPPFVNDKYKMYKKNVDSCEYTPAICQAKPKLEPT